MQIEPVYKTTPYAKQLEVVEDVLAADKAYWALFSEMGVGKSKMTVDIAASYYNYNHELTGVCIIAPNGVHAQWAQEIEKHCAPPANVYVWRGETTKKAKAKIDNFLSLAATGNYLSFLCINIESVRRSGTNAFISSFLTTTKALLVVDEATTIKSHTTAQYKNIQSFAHRAAKRCILTGTPSAQGMMGLWSMFEFLCPRYWRKSYSAFQDRYSLRYLRTISRNGIKYKITTLLDEATWKDIRTKYAELLLQSGRTLESLDTQDIDWKLADKYGTTCSTIQTIIHQDKYTPYRRMDELLNIIKPDVYTIRKKDCKDVPDKIKQVIKLPTSPEQKKLIISLSNYGIAQMGDKTLSLESKVALATRVLQVLGGFMAYNEYEGKYNTEEIPGDNAKLAYLLRNVQELGDEQAIVWCTFKAEGAMLIRELSKVIPTGQLIGDTPKDQREEEKAKFIAGDYRIMVMSPAAGAYGLNFPNATVQYWYSRPWSAILRLQGEDRSHRLTSTSPITYKDLVYENTLDERVLSGLMSGTSLNELLMHIDADDIYKTGVK